MFGIQLLGVVSVIAWVAVTMTVIFQIIKHTVGLRVSREEEIHGLDVEEHGLVSSYADFMPSVNVTSDKSDKMAVAAPVQAAVPVVDTSALAQPSVQKITKIVIITRQNKFEELKAAMNDIGVTGITVIQVLGCGIQKGKSEYYRGVPVELNLLPKVKIEIVVSSVPVEKVVETARRVLYTGHIGDGKIFLYDVENVIKVRTGEQGFGALQDED